MQPSRFLFVAVALALASPTSVLAEGRDDGAPRVPETETVYYDGPAGPDGVLTGGRVELPMPEITRQRLLGLTPRGAGGAPDNRVDLVFVGDGYTASEIGLYNNHVQTVVDDMFVYEPLKAYRNYFAIHAIEVVSSESGVDHDPSFGVLRNTALDMGYWCNNIERLLCVNVNKAFVAAGAAPDIDQIIALANSSKYGGAGYPSSNIGTAPGGNGAAPDIAVHELGHALGDLADEYTYGGPTTYSGSERPERNVSIYDADEMADFGLKWVDWLGDADPRFDGPVGTYEGGFYSVFGVFRPSPNSMMRALGRPFNAVSAEQMILEIYREVSPIDAHTPNDELITTDRVISVTPMQPIGHELDVVWLLDGVEIPGANGASFDLSTLALDRRARISAIVTDNTDMVRNELLRGLRMSDEVAWDITPAGVCFADMDADNDVDFQDFLMLSSQFGNADCD